MQFIEKPTLLGRQILLYNLSLSRNPKGRELSFDAFLLIAFDVFSLSSIIRNAMRLHCCCLISRETNKKKKSFPCTNLRALNYKWKQKKTSNPDELNKKARKKIIFKLKWSWHKQFAWRNLNSYSTISLINVQEATNFSSPFFFDSWRVWNEIYFHFSLFSHES